MRLFFEFFVKRHTFAAIITISIILLGLAVLPSINRDTFPSVDLDEVVITTRYDGSSPEDIELKITNKIEDELKNIDGIKRYASLSIENISLINIFLESDVKDTKKVKDLIRERVDAITDFPIDLKNRPTITEINSSTFPVLEVGLSAKDLNYDELRSIAKEFKADLENIKGIFNVDGYGYLEKELKIQPNPELLDAYQVSLLDLIGVVSNRNLRASMGNIMSSNLNSTIVNDSRLITVEEVNSAILRSNFNGQSIQVSDVAKVSLDFEEPTILSRISGNEGISFSIVKSESSDIITVSNKIQALVNSYQNLYPNLNFVIANDFSKYLKNRLQVMISNGIIGLILVILVLTYFLNKEMAFWVSLGIPVAVMGVFFMMPLFDMTINIISLLALIIVIGIIVDDGIIVAESIAKYREKGYSALEASTKGIEMVFKPVFTTILTTIIAFSPMFFMSGIMGKFIFQIPMVISLALLISLIEVVIALPSHLAANKQLEFKEKPRHLKINQLRKNYERLLFRLLQKKYRMITGFVMVFIVSMGYAVTFMNFVLFPESSAVNFYIRAEAPPGTPLKKTQSLIGPIEKAVLELSSNELLAFTTRIGVTGDAYFLTEQENLGFIMVDLVPFGGRKRSAREIMKEIKTKTENTPGFTAITYQVEAGGPPVGKAINIRVVSDNSERRKNAADEVYRYVKTLPGVNSIDRDDKRQKKQRMIQLDYNAISRLDLSIASIHTTIRSAFSGVTASTMRYDNEDINFNIEFSDLDKSNGRYLEQLLIPNKMGRLIRLKDIATIIDSEGSPNFIHFNGQRTITITGDINKKQITSSEVTKKVMERFNATEFPGVSFNFGGESEETNQSVQDLIRSFILAIIGIFFLLILLFNSFLQPFIVLLTIPFGLIGVIIAFAIHGQDLGFISMVGTVGLTGVVVNDSLVLVNHLNTKFLNSTQPKDSLKIIVEGSGDRFRPILITSFSTVAGLLPLAYGLGGSDPFIAPMALAIGYGLLFSTPLTLFLLPALYLILIDFIKWRSENPILKRFFKNDSPDNQQSLTINETTTV